MATFLRCNAALSCRRRSARDKRAGQVGSGLALQHRIYFGNRRKVKRHLMQDLAPEAEDVAMQDLTLLALLVRGPQFSVSNWSQMRRPTCGKRDIENSFNDFGRA